jgi:hypothetical protein
MPCEQSSLAITYSQLFDSLYLSLWLCAAQWGGSLKDLKTSDPKENIQAVVPSVSPQEL